MAAARGRWIPLAACLAASLVCAPARAQPSSAPTATPSTVAARVHEEGGYPSEVVVLDDDREDTTLDENDPSNGAGDGPHGTVRPGRERDGGDPDRSLDLPMPQFVRDLLDALARLLGAAASTLTYVFFALAIAMIVVFLVFMAARLRFPRRDLARERREDRGTSGGGDVDPLLEEALEEPEVYARQGRFREAIHALFVRSLGRIARDGDVDRRGRTAREVVTLLARVRTTPDELDALLGLTELVWFGGRPATEEQYVAAALLARQLGGEPQPPTRPIEPRADAT